MIRDWAHDTIVNQNLLNIFIYSTLTKFGIILGVFHKRAGEFPFRFLAPKIRNLEKNECQFKF